MKLFIIVGLMVLTTAKGCVEENEEGWETETNTVGYDAEDLAVRTAIADWSQFVAESLSVVDDACVKIAQATDKVDNPGIHRGRLRSAIIKAEGRVEKLSDMLLKAQKIKPHNYKFDDRTLDEIASFKEDFKFRREQLEEALNAMEILNKK